MLEIFIICLTGAIAGWVASAVVNAENGNVLLDILIGIIGGYIGYRLFGTKLNITENMWVNYVITASAGATLLSLGIKLLRIAFRGGRAA